MKIIRSHKPDIVHEWENSGLSYGAEVEDTAFGDRLYSWAAAYELSRRNEFKWKIQVKDTEFPESCFLQFDNTEHISEEEFFNFDGFEEYSKLDFLNAMLYNDTPPDRCIMSSISFDNLNGITFKNSAFEEDLRELFAPYVGVHLRRCHGINYKRSDLKELPSDVVDDYLEYSSWGPQDSFPYYKDAQYFVGADSIEGRMYVSTDLTLKYWYDNWYNRYGTRLYEMNAIYTDYKAIVDRHHPGQVFDQRFLERMCDFFALACCKYVITPTKRNTGYYSAWVRAATQIGHNKLELFTV